MAGIYFHIPFCKQACHYCDFHFSTNFRNVDELIDAMKAEIRLQRNYLDNEEVKTIYFGGGTPSAVPPHYISDLIEEIRKYHLVTASSEITLEANPDDLTQDNIAVWKAAGINRLSVGVQSFENEHLIWMNRAHNRDQAISGLTWAKEAGITNITMDLIYGVPGMTMDQWQDNLNTFFELDLPHLSAYGLTVEPKTHLGNLVKSNTVKAVEDERYNEQLERLISETTKRGFEHYEISNFGMPGRYSKHNTAYWLGEKYLGIGPSAHSFNGTERSWSVSSNMKYVKMLGQNQLPSEVEVLTKNDRFNEYILTRLRTIWGIDLDQIKEQFGSEFQNNLKNSLTPFLKSNLIIQSKNSYTLSAQGKYLADKISSDLFVVD
ncbi:MAG: oxygen-independent coproporphyrinogen-3 oxidase [Salibacteraceae bacterium]|jgi:oxygen-independent coproporphyrinogen-3 oxidase